MLDDMFEKLCLKHKQQNGILLDIWREKRVKLSHPQKNIQLLYPVAYEKLINKLHNRQYF